MNMKLNLILAGLFSGVAIQLSSADEPPLNAHLQIFRPLLDKSWQGTFANSKPDKPIVDVQKWERTLNGQAIRVLHSINQGAYGGETMFFWDNKRNTVVYYYFTTDSFMTTGTLQAENGKFITHEDVKGDANGVTEVRATSELLPDGKFHVKAEYLKDGKWASGHECTYQEAPDAKVVFK
jgi:hypothetical protein